jgi:hypothetical protein
MVQRVPDGLVRAIAHQNHNQPIKMIGVLDAGSVQAREIPLGGGLPRGVLGQIYDAWFAGHCFGGENMLQSFI